MARSFLATVTLVTAVLLIALAPALAQTPVTLKVGSVTGQAGETVSVPVTLMTDGTLVAATQNDLVTATDPIGGPLRVAANPDGTPNCAFNPNIDNDASSFAFLPEGPLVGVRAVVAANDGEPLSNLSVLYTCEVAINDGLTPGEFGLPISNVSARDISGQALSTMGIDGTITVQRAPTPTPTTTPTPIPGGNDNDDGCAVVAPARGGWLLLLPAAVLLWFRRRNT